MEPTSLIGSERLQSSCPKNPCELLSPTLLFHFSLLYFSEERRNEGRSSKPTDLKQQTNPNELKEEAIETHKSSLNLLLQTQRSAAFLSPQTGSPFSLPCSVDFLKWVLSLPSLSYALSCLRGWWVSYFWVLCVLGEEICGFMSG